MGSGGRNGRVLVGAWLPKELVKRLEHACIDLGRRRHEVLEELVTAWLDDRLPVAPPAEGGQDV